MKDFFQRIRESARHALWGEQVTWGALIRVGVWALFFFVLISAGFVKKGLDSKLILYYKQLEGTAVRPMSMAKSDSRGFREGRASIPKNTPYVVWVGGSSLHVRDRLNNNSKKWGYETFIPLEVQAILTPKLDCDIHFDLYIQSAQRLFDQYLCLLDGLDNEPDLVVLTLNPVWMLNAKAPTLWTNAYSATVARGNAGIGDMALMLLFDGPGKIFEGAVAYFSPLVKNRQDYKLDPTKTISPLLGSAVKGQKPSQDKLAQALGMSQPMQFWAMFEKMGGNIGDAADWQRAAMSYVDTRGRSLNHKILDKIFDCLEKAHMPAIVYTAPVVPWVLEDPVLREAVAANEEALEKLARKYDDSQIRVIDENPTRFLRDLEFRDMVHLKNSAQLSAFLAEEVEKLIPPSTKKDPNDAISH